MLFQLQKYKTLTVLVSTGSYVQRPSQGTKAIITPFNTGPSSSGSLALKSTWAICLVRQHTYHMAMALHTQNARSARQAWSQSGIAGEDWHALAVPSSRRWKQLVLDIFSSHAHIHTSLSALASQKQRPRECVHPKLQETLKYASADTWPLEKAWGHLAPLGISMPELAYDKEVCYPPRRQNVGCSDCTVPSALSGGNQRNACKMTLQTEHYEQSHY